MRELLTSTSGIVVEYGDDEEPSSRVHRTATTAAYDNIAPGMLHILEGSTTVAIYSWQYVISVRRLEGEDQDEDQDEEDEQDEQGEEDGQGEQRSTTARARDQLQG